MAVPTISAVTPPSGHTGGRNLVEITGTGFKLWTIPPPGPGIEPPPTPTVEVLFGGEEGTEVAVISATRLLVRVPSSPIPVATPAYGAGAVSIIVRNLDALGVPIPGETVTQPAAYTYDRVQLAAESDLQRLCRTLIQELKKQVITEVAISVHTDWDPDPADLENVVGLASLPGIAIFGPNLVPNRTYSKNGITYRPTVGVESNVRRSPGTDDVTFSITGVSEIKAEAINLPRCAASSKTTDGSRCWRIRRTSLRATFATSCTSIRPGCAGSRPTGNRTCDLSQVTSCCVGSTSRIRLGTHRRTWSGRSRRRRKATWSWFSRWKRAERGT